MAVLTTGGRLQALWAAVVLTVIALGSASPASALPAGCNPRLPVVAHMAWGGRVQLPTPNRLPVACGRPIGYQTSETSIAVAGDGSLIFSPAETENTMARSADAGTSWRITYPQNEQPTSFWNTTDPYVVSDPRTGWVFWSHATGPVRNENQLPPISPLPQGAGFYLAGAQGFQVYSSSDDGRSWSTADYTAALTGDWEKVFVGPPAPKASGAPQPKGYPDVVYLCANAPVEVTGPGRLCYRSLNGGRTFSVASYVSPAASEPQEVCPPVNFNTGVVDQHGTIYQPVDCGRSAYVVVSHDEGSTYSWLPLRQAPTGTPTSGTNLKLAVDQTGNLYAVWTSQNGLYMDVSRDGAHTWLPAMKVAAPGVHDPQLPAIAAGAEGHVGIVYYASPRASATKFSAYITQTADATAARPLFYSGPINSPAHPIFHNYGLNDYPRTDFIGGAYDPAGRVFWAAVVKQLAAPDAKEYIQTVGWVGRLLFRSPTRRPAAKHGGKGRRHHPRRHQRSSRHPRGRSRHRGFTG